MMRPLSLCAGFLTLAQLTSAAPGVAFVTYFGGVRRELGGKLAVDSSGNAYLAGTTTSFTLPAPVAPFSGNAPLPRLCFLSAAFSYDCAGSTAFFAGIDSTGKRLNSTAFLGGLNGKISAVATDSAGAVYVAGSTIDEIKAANGQSVSSGNFLAKIDPQKFTLVFVTSLQAVPAALALDAQGNIIVAGSAEHTGFATDGIVERFSPDGARRLSVAWVGGAAKDSIVGFSLRPDGTLLVAGMTESSDFLPGTSPGSFNAFLARVDTSGAVTGATLIATLAGVAPNGDLALSAATGDGSGNLYLTGTTNGTIPGALGRYAGGGDAWVARIRVTDLKPSWFAVAGGTRGDAPSDIAADSSGRAWIVGSTSSRDFSVTPNAIQATSGGGVAQKVDSLTGGVDFGTQTDGFVTAVNADGTAFFYSSYLGGSSSDEATGVAADPSGAVYISGHTRSDNLRYTRGQMQPDRAPGGSCYSLVSLLGQPRPAFEDYPCEDAFLMKISPDATGAPSPQLVSAATLTALPVAPGSIVSVFGTGLGPAVGVAQRPDTAGKFGTSLGGTRLLFDGHPAPILYVSDTQINAVAPFALSGPRTHLQVETSGTLRDADWWSVEPVAPAIFALSSSGEGGGAIVNQDLTVNGAANPANRGDIVVLYLAGGGQTSPAGVDGATVAAPYPALAQGLQVWFSSIFGSGVKRRYSAGTVLYAGPAPGLISGAVQVNVRVPADADTGSAVSLYVVQGRAAGAWYPASQNGITLSLK